MKMPVVFLRILGKDCVFLWDFRGTTLNTLLLREYIANIQTSIQLWELLRELLLQEVEESMTQCDTLPDHKINKSTGV